MQVGLEDDNIDNDLETTPDEIEVGVVREMFAWRKDLCFPLTQFEDNICAPKKLLFISFNE